MPSDKNKEKQAEKCRRIVSPDEKQKSSVKDLKNGATRQNNAILNSMVSLISFNKEHWDRVYYQQFGDMDEVQNKTLLGEATELGVRLERKLVRFDEFIDYIQPGVAIIVLLDWNVVLGKDAGYQGHFVPIVGYDQENVYVHNHGMGNPTQFMAIPRDVFEAARTSDGTDEDFIVIRK